MDRISGQDGAVLLTRPLLRRRADLPGLPDSDKPVCRCHGEPMRKHASEKYWRCAVKYAAAQASYDARNPSRRSDLRKRLKASGLCTYCGKQPLVTEVRCGDCAIALCERARQYRSY